MRWLLWSSIWRESGRMTMLLGAALVGLAILVGCESNGDRDIQKAMEAKCRDLFYTDRGIVDAERQWFIDYCEIVDGKPVLK